MSHNLEKLFSLVFFITQLCIEISDARRFECLNFIVKDLDIVCGIMDGKTILTALPPQCTAVAQYTSNMEKLRAAYKMKGNLPFIILVDSLDYRDDYQIDKLRDQLADIKVDFAAFNLHKLLHSAEHLSDATESVRGWLQKLYNKAPWPVGFMIENDMKYLKENRNFNFAPINGISDIYVLQSTGYRDCDYHQHQGAMPTLATKDDVEGSLDGLKAMNLDLTRLIYTIELKIESKYLLDAEDMSYSHMCSTKMSVNRKYCFQPIECLFDKARIRQDYNCSGIFVMGIEYDDTDGLCGCITKTDADPKFRGLKTIAGASQEKTNPVDFYKCFQGEFPAILD